jgi:ribonuclease HI
MGRGSFIFYVDGSAQPNPGPSAAAAIAYDPQTMKIQKKYTKFLGNSTNNRAELEAVLLVTEKFSPELIQEIYSDSNYVVKGYNLYSKKWILRNGVFYNRDGQARENSDLWLRLLKYKFHKITWVRAHGSNPYNNLVDKLARSALLRT